LAGEISVNPPPVLALVEDTHPVVMPEVLAEFSSHQMLWERIADELASDPFALTDGPAPYLEGRMRRLGVSAEGFDAASFIERLGRPVVAAATSSSRQEFAQCARTQLRGPPTVTPAEPVSLRQFLSLLRD